MRYYILTGLCVVFLVGLIVPSSVLGYAVGHGNPTFTDPARTRDINVHVYYPAETAGDDVPVASGTFPVVVFGHGFLIGYGSYSFLWNGVVPEGYILVFPTTEGGLSPDHGAFGLDLAFLCDHFQVLNTDPGSPFYQHVAPDTAVMGHSMGGGASFLAVADSAAVTALANFTAAETNPSAIQAAALIDLPTLMFAGTEDCVTPPEDHQIPMYNALISDCKTLVTITGASHCQYAGNNSTCVLGEFFAGCSANIPLGTQEALTLDVLLPWFDSVLRGNAAGWTAFMDTLNTGTTQGTLTYVQDCPAPVTPTPTATAAPTATSTPECLNTGDATLDGTLTAGDAQMIFNIVLGTITPTYEEACAADCSGDGSITAGDAQQTFMAVLGTDSCVDPL